MQCLVGTSGYNFEGWKGVFYPADLPASRWLSYYAQRLPTVEINYTFYRIPNSKTLEGWDAQVPEHFRFALKASQRITHRTKLQDAESTAYFCDKVKSLQGKLGPTLVQLPPTFRKDAERLRTFLASLAPHIRPALEFRHKSWFDDEIRQILTEARAALCIAEDEDLQCPLWATSTEGYVRLRLQEYSAAALRDWADRIKAQPWERCFIYFKHEDAAQGVGLADQLKALLPAG